MDAAERCWSLIQRCSHHDKDERYMAISDLRSEIESLDVIDASLQTSIRQAILKRLEDSSNDVQAIAVNCFSSMAEKFDPSQVAEIIGTLCDLSNIKSGSALKEVYAEALRGILEHVPWSLGEQVSSLLLPVLLGTLSSVGQPDARDENDGHFWCLLLLQTVLERFVGSPLGDDSFKSILTILVRLLMEESDYNNNFIPNVVACFASVCPSHLLVDLVEQIMTRVSSSLPDAKIAVLVLTLSNIARKAGPRVVQHAKLLVPALQRVVVPGRPIDFEDARDEIVTVRYHSLVVLECLVRVGPQYVVPYCSSLLDAAMTLMVLDPNFLTNDGSDTAMDELDEDDWGLEPDVAPDEDAGDTTWKVRMAALKLLSAWISCRTFQTALLANITLLFDRLANRFDERDAAVQTQVFDTFTVLQQRLASLLPEEATDEIASHFLLQIFPKLYLHVMSAKCDVKRSTANALLSSISLFGKRLFSGPNDALTLILSEIVDKSNSSVQLIALDSLKAAINVVPFDQLVRMNLQGVVQSLVTVLTDDPSKLSPALFDNIIAVCTSLRPSDNEPGTTEIAILFRPLFEIARRLRNDLTEMHIAACVALAEFCSSFGGSLPGPELYNCIELFLLLVEIRNVESTGLQCLAIMANTAVMLVHQAMEPHVTHIFRNLLDLISAKQNDAAAAPYLVTMAALVSQFPSQVPAALLCECLQVCARLDDPSVIGTVHHLAATIMTQSIDRHFTPADDVISSLTDQSVHILSNADSQQRSTVFSSQSLLVAISRVHSQLRFEQLIEQLMELGSRPNFCLHALALTIASCCIARFDTDSLVQRMSRLLSSVEHHLSSSYSQLVVTITGDVARLTSLPESFVNQLFMFLSSYISCGDEHVKSSAAVALGACVSSSLDALFPLLLDIVMRSETTTVCFSLHAVKEVLISPKSCQLAQNAADTVFDVLMKHADANDEGVRTVVSECLGKLLALDSIRFSTKTLSMLDSSSARIRASVITAIKFYYAQTRNEGIPSGSLFPLLQDSDISVRRQVFLAFVTLLSSAKSFANLDAAFATLVPLAVRDIQVRSELIRKIDFGAFQETVDEGLQLRQAAHSFLKTACELYPEQVSAELVVLALAKHGVSDPDTDLQCCSFEIMAGLADRLPAGISIGFLDELPTILLPSVKNWLAQIKRNAADNDARRILTSFIITVHKLHGLPGVKADCPKLHIFYLQVLRTSLLSDILREYGLL